MTGNSNRDVGFCTIEVYSDKKDYYDDSGFYDTDHSFKELTITVDGEQVTIPKHESGKIGTIGTIFGGGNAAKVIGNTNVSIGTQEYILITVDAGITDVSTYYTQSGAGTDTDPFVYTPFNSKAEDGTTYYEKSGDEYTQVSNVTAGETDVTDYYTRTGAGTDSNPYVYTAVKSAVEGVSYYEKVIGADIKKDVFGGGNQADVTGDSNIVIGR